jgi:hypothetical protein
MFQGNLKMPDKNAEEARKLLAFLIASGLFVIRGDWDDNLFTQAERFVEAAEKRYGKVSDLIGI